MTIDNFDEIRRHLTFESNFDRYIVHIIKRAKDDEGRTYGVNETNRLLKTFYITSVEYFDKKIPVIRDLCDRNRARAYVLPQVRNNEDCLKELLKIVVDNISNPTIKPDHLIRSAFCGYHGSRDKKWIIDLDCDNMVEYKETMGFPCCQIEERRWTPEGVLGFVRKQLKATGKNADDAYMIPTRNGNCIITSPFNLQKAYEECAMMYQGVHSVTTSYEKKETELLRIGFRFIPVENDITGWLVKDGMALMYFNDGTSVE